MSAIAGMFHADGRPADHGLLRRMAGILAHRGPDGEGEWVSGAVALGHRLLHTTPESLTEKQPVTDERGEYWLVWDGRLDNREELAAALKAEGWFLPGQSDPELVLQAYQQWGADCLKRILGEFAFALWDGRRRTLLCARDPIGVKPFYYYWDGTRFLFASEVKAVLEDRTVPRRPNEATIADYLLMGFRDPEATFFDGIKQLRPAHFLCLGDQGLRMERYWDIDPSSQIWYDRDVDHEEQFRDLFREAVRCRLRSHAPVGILLSGGIDSPIVTAMAERLSHENGGGPELAAFTWVSEATLKEEWQALGEVLKAYGTEHHPIRQENEHGPISLFELFLPSAETPHYEPLVTIPFMLEPVAARGCRVVLTGFAADELCRVGEFGFIGDLFRSLRLARFAREFRLMVRTYGLSLGWMAVMLAWNQLAPEVRRVTKTLLGRQVPAWVNPAFAPRMRLVQRVVPRPGRHFLTLCQEEPYRALTKPAIALLLNQIDGQASGFSLECRHPFLDRRLIEFFLAIPPEVTMQAGYRKQFLQRALAEIIPGSVRQQEGTDYFIPEMDQRLCRKLDAPTLERALSNGRAPIYHYVDRTQTERLLERYVQQGGRYRNLLWSFARLAVWLEEWFPERGST
jgi:asparagine synthase (glutamine-hydrolysing)